MGNRDFEPILKFPQTIRFRVPKSSLSVPKQSSCSLLLPLGQNNGCLDNFVLALEFRKFLIKSACVWGGGAKCYDIDLIS